GGRREVVAGLGGQGADLLGRAFARLGQGPEIGGARARAAVAEDRVRQVRQGGLETSHVVRRHGPAANGNVDEGQARSLGGGADVLSHRLARLRKIGRAHV